MKTQNNVVLLTASYESGGYLAITAFATKELANLCAMHLIAEHVEGQWQEYRSTDVKTLKKFIKKKQYDQARVYWNGMSSLTLTIDENVEVQSIMSDTFNFRWE